eukprot:CAMPEP_0184333324 /NCGR_PEP_ID=MMETSP1089-20130417/2318_1 /TAXON_ID=38269 ORGANISM="Gloeochaete wittrockiana, Strain SAG46.84" /NCGR_SAMPLE_ID=MMETSP1089 /ASSEMBLY_ACC=CAM_ASM_000445 /LENGTH=562 /DNA_ID=CAMNT_0026657071 /DNA_START=24 /DNA_END=1712 /DNA_ORIENTATION=-
MAANNDVTSSTVAIAEIVTDIEMYDAKCTSLLEEGHFMEAIRAMERGVLLKSVQFGKSSDQVSTACHSLAMTCNSLAMRYLETSEFALALDLLKKAEILTDKQSPISSEQSRKLLRGVTFNNFGCYYRRRGKLHAALQYLDKALRIELTSSSENPAGTHLNLCATLSQLGKHGAARDHAQCALDILLIETNRMLGKETDQQAILLQQPQGAILPIAYYNLAVELEYLGESRESVQSYERAVAAATIFWGADHPNTAAIMSAKDDALRKFTSGMPAKHRFEPPQIVKRGHSAPPTRTPFIRKSPWTKDQQPQIDEANMQSMLYGCAPRPVIAYKTARPATASSIQTASRGRDRSYAHHSASGPLPRVRFRPSSSPPSEYLQSHQLSSAADEHQQVRRASSAPTVGNHVRLSSSEPLDAMTGNSQKDDESSSNKGSDANQVQLEKQTQDIQKLFDDDRDDSKGARGNSSKRRVQVLDVEEERLLKATLADTAKVEPWTSHEDVDQKDFEMLEHLMRKHGLDEDEKVIKEGEGENKVLLNRIQSISDSVRKLQVSLSEEVGDLMA